MIQQIKFIETILYVNNQEESTKFYKNLFREKPELYIPGMTEFLLAENFKLGLMPNNNIVKILKEKTPHPEQGNGIPRCELYLYVDDIQFEFDNAVKCGAELISSIEERDWGDKVCYFADPDRHIIAFAEKIKK